MQMGCPTQWGVAPLHLLLRPPHSCWHLCPPTLRLHPLPVTLTPGSPHFLSQDHHQEGSACIDLDFPGHSFSAHTPKTTTLGSPRGLLPPPSETWSQTLMPPGAWLSPNPHAQCLASATLLHLHLDSLRNRDPPTWTPIRGPLSVQASAHFPCPRHSDPAPGTTVSRSARPQLLLAFQSLSPMVHPPRGGCSGCEHTSPMCSSKSTPSQVLKGAQARAPCTRKCTGAPPAATRRWKQPKCPPTREWVSQTYALHTTDYHPAVQSGEAPALLWCP